MGKKKEFRKTVRLFEVLSNLASIPRIGPVIWEGVPASETESIADHKLKVGYLAMVLGDLVSKEGKKIDMEHLLRKIIIHDWDEAILGDIPSRSPSYQSYFEQDVRDLHQQGQKKAIREMTAFVRNGIGKDYSQINEDQSHPLETSIERMADVIANLLELLTLRKRGYRSKYIEAYWVRLLQQLEEFGKEFSFTKGLIEALNEGLDKFTELNPFLAKGKYPGLKEYRKER